MENLPARKEEPLSLLRVSEALFKSGLFPNTKNPFGAFSIVQYGAELGIGPMTSLQTMAIISGKICMAGQMMLSLALKSGVSYRIIEDSDLKCIVSFKRESLEYTSSFSIEEAKKAGIWRAQSGWEKFPRDMLFWRTVTRGLRRVAPDTILGLYAIEEIKDAPPLDTAIDIPMEEKKKEAQDEVPSNQISDSQRKRFYTIAKKTGANDDQIKEWLFSEYAFSSTRDITKDIYDEICQRAESIFIEPGSEG